MYLIYLEKMLPHIMILFVYEYRYKTFIFSFSLRPREKGSLQRQQDGLDTLLEKVGTSNTV